MVSFGVALELAYFLVQFIVSVYVCGIQMRLLIFNILSYYYLNLVFIQFARDVFDCYIYNTSSKSMLHTVLKPHTNTFALCPL